VHDQDLVFFASATTRSKKSSSTHCAVGFDGKPSTIILGFG
jgi:hypothetical protein